VLGAANITHAEKVRLLQKLRALEADIVIIDVAPAWLQHARLFGLGSRKLLVTHPRSRHPRRLLVSQGAVLLSCTTTRQGIERLLERPRRVRGRKVVEILPPTRRRPELADKVFAELGRFGACLVGNQG